MIDILVPVLARPQNAQPLMDSITACTTAEHRVHFLCSPSDPGQIAACEQTGALVHVMDFPPRFSDYGRKMQWGYENTDGEYLFLAADDIEFTPGWDREVLRQPGAVVGTNDMANASVKRGQFGTHCLVERRYVTEQGASADGPGILIHRGYDHNFTDRELCGVAQHRGVWSFARKAVVRHRHPLWRNAPDDSTYKKSLRNFHRDRVLFLRRAEKDRPAYPHFSARHLAQGRGMRRGRAI